MWQGQQSPGDPRHPQGGQANPYQQPSPYEPPPQPPRGGGNRTKVIAIAAATAVVVAAGVTGFLVLGGDKDAEAKDPKPATGPSSPAPSTDPGASAGADNPRADRDPEPVVPGWKVVTNPAKGVAFDVPPEWDRKQTDWVTYVAENDDPEDKPLVAFMAPAMLDPTWCSSGSGDKKENMALAAAGSRSERGQDPEAAARANAEAWLYGFYTQPDKKKIKSAPAEQYTTKSGLSGTLVTSAASGVPKKNKCASDGKATAFVFKNPKGNEYTSWTLFAAKDVKNELPDDTVRKILSTVRLLAPAK
ncbi:MULTISPECIES: hypothetical protein [Streptomyces]|uniref:hypothetical protein n=1 Tax=Streptomyces TaxID=1883 RepID=UPI00345C171A